MRRPKQDKRNRPVADADADAAKAASRSLEAAWGVRPTPPPVICLDPYTVPDASPLAPLYLVDLFCGLGGFSEGARQAGCKVAVAVDSWDSALRLHRANHPETVHYKMTLGPGCEPRLKKIIAKHVPPGAKWHLHMSPPCTAISKLHIMNSTNGFNDGMKMVMWSLAMAFKLKPTTWSFEQAPEREILGILRWLEYSKPDKVRSAAVYFSDYGVGQPRRRSLAGSPKIISNFLTNKAIRAPAPKLTDILRPPPGAFWLRASTGKTPRPELTTRNEDGTYSNPSIRRDVQALDKVSWSVVAMHPHAFLTEDYRHIRELTPAESAALQSFPTTYTLELKGVQKVDVQRAVGNAVPPRIAQLLMSAVV